MVDLKPRQHMLKESCWNRTSFLQTERELKSEPRLDQSRYFERQPLSEREVRGSTRLINILSRTARIATGRAAA